MDEFDKILLRQYRRDLDSIWDGVREIEKEVLPAADIVEGFATKGRIDLMKTHGPEATALFEISNNSF